MTSSRSASLSLRSAVKSSASSESASVIAAAQDSLESVRIASGRSVSVGLLVFSGSSTFVAISSDGTGLKIGERALFEGQVRLLWPDLWQMLHLRDMVLDEMVD